MEEKDAGDIGAAGWHPSYQTWSSLRAAVRYLSLGLKLAPLPTPTHASPPPASTSHTRLGDQEAEPWFHP